MSLFNCLLCNGCRLRRSKWLRSIALALEIAILLLLSLGGGNLRKYPHAAGNHRKTRRKPLATDMVRKSAAVSTAFNISLHN